MAFLILALLQRIFLMSSLMLLLVWLIFFMVLIKLLPILGTISGKRSEERFSRNAETDLVCRLLIEKKKSRARLATHQNRSRPILLSHPYIYGNKSSVRQCDLKHREILRKTTPHQASSPRL